MTIESWEYELMDIAALQSPCQRWYGKVRVSYARSFYQVFIHGGGRPARIRFECRTLDASRYQCALWLVKQRVRIEDATNTCPTE